MRIPVHQSERGITIIWADNGQMIVDAIGMYVDYLCDAFDRYKGGDLKQHCVDHFRRELEDIEHAPGDAPQKRMMVEVCRYNLAKMEGAEPHVVAKIMEHYRANPTRAATALIKTLEQGEEYEIHPLDGGEDEQPN